MIAFKCLEIEMSQLSTKVEDLLKGDITALLVKSAMLAQECEVVYHNFINSKGLYKRKDGVPAIMVGANTYLRNASAVISEIQQNNAYAELLFNGTRNIYREVYDCIEDAGYRFRRAYINGTPAPQYRGTIWNDTIKMDNPLLAHTDWPQVRYSQLEFQNVLTPVAINFYPKHPSRGDSSLRLYDLVPDTQMLNELGIENSGYPIKQESLSGINFLDIEPEQGDILFFNAAYVHAVKNESKSQRGEQRLNINGFLGFCPELNRVLSWT